MDTLPISNDALGPELNPLHNPILAENLDRWAHVYAAATPESRTQALQQLLYELKEERASGQVTDMRSEELVPAPTADSVEISCPQCGKIKESGQRFCGFCGADFSAVKNEPEAVAPPPIAAPRSSQPAPYATRELDSLRELSFSTIYDSAESNSNGWRYTIVTLVVLICLGAVAYIQWRTQILAEWNKIVAPNSASTTAQQTSTPATAPTTPSAQQAANTPTTAQTSENPTTAAAEPANASADKPTNSNNAQTSAADNTKASDNVEKDNPAKDNTARVEADDSESVTAIKPAPKKPVTPAVKREPEDSFVDNGSAELATAQNYLNGTYGNRNTAQAATWLWKSVSKQNPTALVLLSDLYARGDGVSKNCDQARLLLVAAAKKGAPDAGPKLRNFERNGCR